MKRSAHMHLCTDTDIRGGGNTKNYRPNSYEFGGCSFDWFDRITKSEKKKIELKYNMKWSWLSLVFDP